jgi:hypothetical protein
VYLFCRQKFQERIVTESRDYIYQLLPRQLATSEEYFRGFLIYFGTMASLVTVLSLLGPNNLSALGMKLPDGVNYLILPLDIALVLIGAVPNIPGVMLLEKYLRTYAHQRAYIPDSALATANRLAAADFDFTRYDGETLQSREMRGVELSDFTQPRGSLRNSWARLCCLVFVLKSCRIEGLTEPLDATMLRDYERDLELIESKKKSMESEIALYRAAKANDRYYSNDDLRHAIRDNLYKLYILLGCAVRLKMQPHDDIDLALSRFGFKLESRTRARNTGDLQLIALTVVAITVTIMGFAAAWLGRLALWPLSPVFPQTMFQPFIDTAAVLVPHATAIMVADWIRKRAIRKEAWFSGHGSHRRGDVANYIRVGLICGFTGYIGLIVWGLTQQKPTLAGFMIDAPNALLAMTTGSFYAYHLDNAEMGRRPSRVWELGSQTALTGICGLVAACITWEVIFGTDSAAIDKIVLTTIINATVGLTFGYYLPLAAAADQHNPLLDASDERVAALETTAQARLGDHEASSWLDTPQPGLGDKTPRAAAAAEVEAFAQAIAALNEPLGLTEAQPNADLKAPA